MRDEAAEVAADYAVPGGIVLVLELAADKRRDVLLDQVDLLGSLRDTDRVQLHLLCHVRVLDVPLEELTGTPVLQGVFLLVMLLVRDLCWGHDLLVFHYLNYYLNLPEG